MKTIFAILERVKNNNIHMVDLCRTFPNRDIETAIVNGIIHEDWHGAVSLTTRGETILAQPRGDT